MSPFRSSRDSSSPPPVTRCHGRGWLVFALMGCVAVIIPAIVLGRSVVGIAPVLAMLTLPFLDCRREWWDLAKRVFASRAALLVAMVAVAWLPSLMASSDPLESFGTHIRTFAYFALGVIVWAAMRVERDNADIAYRTLLLATAILGGVGMIGLFVSTEFLQLLRGHGWIEYSARRALKESASSAAVLLAIVVLAGCRLRGVWRLIAAVAAVEMLLLIYFTANRSAMAGLLAAGLGVLVLVASRAGARRTRLVSFVGVVALLAAGAWGLVHFQYPPGSYPDAQLTPIPYWLIDPPRQAIWLNAWEAGEPYRLFGAGINVIDELPGAHEWNPATGTRNIPLHPHDWVLEIIVETGLVGFGAMILALAYITRALIRDYLHSGHSGTLAANYVWIAYWTSGLFNVSYWSSWWQVSFVAAMVICLAFRESASPGAPGAAA